MKIHVALNFVYSARVVKVLNSLREENKQISSSSRTREIVSSDQHCYRTVNEHRFGTLLLSTRVLTHSLTHCVCVCHTLARTQGNRKCQQGIEKKVAIWLYSKQMFKRKKRKVLERNSKCSRTFIDFFPYLHLQSIIVNANQSYGNIKFDANHKIFIIFCLSHARRCHCCCLVCCQRLFDMFFCCRRPQYISVLDEASIMS